MVLEISFKYILRLQKNSETGADHKKLSAQRSPGYLDPLCISFYIIYKLLFKESSKKRRSDPVYRLLLQFRSVC